MHCILLAHFIMSSQKLYGVWVVLIHKTILIKLQIVHEFLYNQQNERTRKNLYL
jgi:hypothetical protein